MINAALALGKRSYRCHAKCLDGFFVCVDSRSEGGIGNDTEKLQLSQENTPSVRIATEANVGAIQKNDIRPDAIGCKRQEAVYGGENR
jgi:hypothetical protein